MEVGVSVTGVVVDRPHEAREIARAAADLGIDHLQVGDHVSFHDGTGFDGLLHAAAFLAFQDRLPVRVGLYLVALRHPVVTARQVADLARLFPGRVGLGVGVGGEDRHEYEVAGVDPRTRGRRTDEHLEVLRKLLDGGPVTHHGRSVDLDAAVVAPSPDPAVPVVVGGRSDAALRRAGRLGDGWLGLWVSARRFGEAVETVADAARAAGRDDVAWRHGLSVWCATPGPDGVGGARLAEAMEQRYKLPFERFERWCPVGEPAEIAAFLAPYADAGCGDVTLTFPTAEPRVALEQAAEVRRELGALLPVGQ